MNKTVRLALLAVLALTLTCLCLAGPIHHHRMPHSSCVPRCGHYCESLGLLTRETCSSCTCYSPAPVYYGCSGCGYSGSYGCDGGYGCYGCDGCGGYGGGCGGGGCGGGGCGGGC